MAKDQPNINISSFLDTTGLIERAFTQPVMRIKPRSKLRPDIDVALKAVVNQIESEASEVVATDVRDKVQDMYDNYTLMNGDREGVDPGAVSDWEGGLDDVLEETIEEWVPHLSADWLGTHTIGSSLWEPDAISVFAAKLGREYFHEITYRLEKSAAKILSSAGILQKQVEAALELHINPTEQEQQDMAEKQDSELTEVVAKIKAHIGPDFDTMSVYDLIDRASEDDEIMVAGALPELGLGAEDGNALQMARLEYGGDVMDVILKMIAEAPSAKKSAGANLPKSASASKGKSVSTKAASGTVDEAAEGEDVFDPALLKTLKEAGFTDEHMGKAIGISRAGYNNILNGKVAFTPTAEQVGSIRAELVEKLNSLHEVLGVLDSQDPTVVF